MTLTLTAETAQGRQALAEVMHHSYEAEIDSVPPAWARVRVVDGVPVSFILVDPARRMDFLGGDLPFAFICDTATRADRRNEGHFAALLADTFMALRASGTALVLTHGRYPLYRRFGFDVFTHHCGVFITPEQIEARLGAVAAVSPQRLLVVDNGPYYQDDLMVVSDVVARALPECRMALQAAAALARERGKSRILFEHPAAPSYGSRYPIYRSLQTRFMALARACGAQVCIEPANPEAGVIPDADWIKVLDMAALLRQVTGKAMLPVRQSLALSFDTDAGAATLQCGAGRLAVQQGMPGDALTVRWPSAALAQLITGYQSADSLAQRYNTTLPPPALALLNQLFPRYWRLSRNESWTFKP
ncbi:MAG: GNAT family N-acetyltransferase [Chloroflexi bacterium]|nr:GNAT family N-acetyltransferase [Chloroflexota bacterium]